MYHFFARQIYPKGKLNLEKENPFWSFCSPVQHHFPWLEWSFDVSTSTAILKEQIFFFFFFFQKLKKYLAQGHCIWIQDEWLTTYRKCY